MKIEKLDSNGLWFFVQDKNKKIKYIFQEEHRSYDSKKDYCYYVIYEEISENEQISNHGN